MEDDQRDMKEHTLYRAIDQSTTSDDHVLLLEEWMNLYGRDLLNLAYAYVKDRMQAEDIVQDTFLKAFTNMSQFRHESSIKTWMYRITIN